MHPQTNIYCYRDMVRDANSPGVGASLPVQNILVQELFNLLNALDKLVNASDSTQIGPNSYVFQFFKHN